MSKWLLSLLLIGITAMAQERIALLIGNGKYKYNGKVYWSRLENPKNEVELVTQALKKSGFHIFPKGEAHCDLSRPAMNYLLYEFKKQAEKAKVVLFYYAGHGIQWRTDQYLIPVDMPPKSDITIDNHKIDGINTEIDKIKGRLRANDPLKYNELELEQEAEKQVFDTKAIAVESVKNIFNRSKVNIFVVNACRNIFGLKRGGKALPATPEIKGTFTLYSTKSGEEVSDKLDFAKAFIAQLGQEDLPLTTMAKKIRKQLLGRGQEVDFRDFLDGVFYIGPRKLAVEFVKLPRKCRGRVCLAVKVTPTPERVEYFLDDDRLGEARWDDGSYVYNWDSRNYKNGKYLLMVCAFRQKDGKKFTKERVVEIANPQPVVTLEASRAQAEQQRRRQEAQRLTAEREEQERQLRESQRLATERAERERKQREAEQAEQERKQHEANKSVVERSSDGRYEVSILQERKVTKTGYLWWAESKPTVYQRRVITDTKTGLQWCVGPDRDTNWNEAKSWAENLTVAGGGWRLPTLDELEGIYEKNKGFEYAHIDKVFWDKNTYIWVWSGKSEGSSSAWFFGFYRGNRGWYPRSFSYYRRAFAVRSGGR